MNMRRTALLAVMLNVSAFPPLLFAQNNDAIGNEPMLNQEIVNDHFAKDLITIAPTLVKQTLALDATIEAVKNATVSAQTSARILAINYDVNDRVPEGAELLRMTNKEQGAELTRVDAELASAKAINIETQAQLQRLKQLFPQGAVSQGDMDKAIANAKSATQAVNAAQSQVDKAIENVKYTQVFAPFSGIVTARHVEMGETVQPGQALLSGYSNQAMRAVTWVPERYLAALTREPAFTIRLSDGRVLSDITAEISPFADPKSHAYMVRLSLPSQLTNLSPGSSAKVSFTRHQAEQIQIPETAIYHLNQLSAVYLWQQGKYLLTQVRLGETHNGQVQILSGLSAGDKIAINPYQVLVTGAASPSQHQAQ